MSKCLFLWRFPQVWSVSCVYIVMGLADELGIQVLPCCSDWCCPDWPPTPRFSDPHLSPPLACPTLTFPPQSVLVTVMVSMQEERTNIHAKHPHCTLLSGLGSQGPTHARQVFYHGPDTPDQLLILVNGWWGFSVKTISFLLMLAILFSSSWCCVQKSHTSPKVRELKKKKKVSLKIKIPELRNRKDLQLQYQGCLLPPATEPELTLNVEH